jgi:hypothetical protein
MNISENPQPGGVETVSKMPNEMPDAADYVLDLRTVLKSVLKWSWLIVVLGLVGLVYGLNKTTQFNPSYTAKMIISPQAPAPGFGSGGTSNSAAGLTSRIAAVLGGPGASSGGEMFERLKLVVKSQQLARRLDERHGFSREIFASSWDSEKGDWKPKVKMEPSWRQRLDTFLHQTQNLSIGTEALARAVGGMVQFVKVGETQFWEVQIKHSDPEIALRWLIIIFAEADKLLRDQDRAKMRQQVQFLQERVKTAELAGLRVALYGALIGQEKSLHMMESGLPYAANIVEPAYASALKTTPNLVNLIAIPTFGAAFIGLMLVILISVFIKE